jgi:hypothetical protein
MHQEINPVEQVRRAKARYCRLIDTRSWQDFAELFLPDVRIRMIDPEGHVIVAFDERDAFLAVTRSFLEGARSIHHVHNDEIDQISATQIEAIWSMEDQLVFPSPRADQPARMHGYGHYHESWVLTPGGWRIARLELRRTILDITN